VCDILGSLGEEYDDDDDDDDDIRLGYSAV
jgi:hypothetical protein